MQAWCPGGLTIQKAFLQLPLRIESIASIPAPAALNVAFFDPLETGVS